MEQQQQLAAEYSARTQSIANLIRQIAELEQERTEHALVNKTLAQAQPNRNCAMLVGSVLCQQTVQEVLPKVQQNEARINQVLDKLNAELKEREQSLQEFKKEHNIQIRGE
jgi:prefoldin subunit 2